MKRLISSLFVFFFAANCLAQNNTHFTKIDSLLTYLNSHDKFMGSLAIMDKGQIVFDKAYGFADVDKKIKANVDTKYKIGSITKMFTAVVIFQLIDEGKLRLDTKLAKFYSKVPNADKITIGNLLNHRSGIYNFTNDKEFNADKKPQSKEAIVEKISSYTSVFEPNSKGDYSNSNYMLLGYIIEDITKKSYDDNIKDRIISKIGLQNTQYYSTINSSRNEAYSYTFKNNKWNKFEEWDNSFVFASGGIQSTGSDLNIFINALFNGKLMTPKSFEEMKKLEDNYGKGILTFPFGERRFYGHNGGTEAFISSLGYYPSDKISFALLTNGNNYNNNDIVLGILSTLYKMPYRFPNLTTVKVKPEILAKYVGTYSSENFPLKILIKQKEGGLIAQASGQGEFPLTATSENIFIFDQAGVEMTFTTNTMILSQGGISNTLKKE
ncbi:serine hydrolase domain-containing protein [Flavobacterium sp. '19STA2R22 D10 B1']|uniref:serine hydrolase domain-containing protein n=1 Tax=Flavobacterium aerium TaxID=3037261 RepID=UPI00278BDD2A|nr:serine hydrolase domain-containing protein [Flavobacterium sp. '19STA2R22 D10 B1']